MYHFFRQLWLVLGVKLMEINVATAVFQATRFFFVKASGIVGETQKHPKDRMPRLQICPMDLVKWNRDLTRPKNPPNGGLVREIPLFQGNLGWWNIIIWPDGWYQAGSKYWWFTRVWRLGFYGPNLQPAGAFVKLTNFNETKKQKIIRKKTTFPRFRWYIICLHLF